MSTNRLAAETSPYLRQHSENPVDWYPWGEEAFEAAQTADKPIFLSIGYSACHWCHVMAHESFESEVIAKIMNAKFVNVKVDREERPDVDEIYMNAVQLMTQQGGWPMSVFLTPTGEPFYGGTYFPPDSRHGRPGFPQVLESVARFYVEKREEVARASGHLVEGLTRSGRLHANRDELDPDLVARAAVKLAQNVDDRHGGFGTHPKFPNTMNLEVLLRHHTRSGEGDALNCVTLTLDRMADGGIYDHLGGGFHRYSVDAEWLVPHFEKMLYDNALLSALYTRAFTLTGTERYRTVAMETLDYVLAEMTAPSGGFYSTQDADSEGVEGKYFVWSRDEVVEVIGPSRADAFCTFYDVSEGGNFEGNNILHVTQDVVSVAELLGLAQDELRAELAASRAELKAARDARVAPGRDDKIQANWNGLMIEAFAIGAEVFGEERYERAAKEAARFIVGEMRQNDGRLWHSHHEGRPRFNGYHDDYACLINGLVDLYEATFDTIWLDEAVSLADIMVEQFWDDEEGGFFYTGRDHEALIVRSKNPYDNATPSGNATAATVLARLGVLVRRDDFAELADRTVRLFQPYLRDLPSGFGRMLLAADFVLTGPTEIVVVGALRDDAFDHLVRVGWQSGEPNRVVAAAVAGEEPIPAVVERQLHDDRATAYVCRGQTCSAPIHAPDDLKTALRAVL